MADSFVDKNGVSSYNNSKVLANEYYYKTTEAVVNNPFKEAHVDRTVVVDWGEDGPGFKAKGKIDTGARGISRPQVMSVPPLALSIHPPTTFKTPTHLIDTPPSIQFAEYLRQQPSYPGQQPGNPGQQTGYPGQHPGQPPGNPQQMHQQQMLQQQHQQMQHQQQLQQQQQQQRGHQPGYPGMQPGPPGSPGMA
jgi:hypothetical protein